MVAKRGVESSQLRVPSLFSALTVKSDSAVARDAVGQLGGERGFGGGQPTLPGFVCRAGGRGRRWWYQRSSNSITVTPPSALPWVIISSSSNFTRSFVA